ncbi:helix-turn-helix domain-containing protein [Paenibacillus thalictri]|uniref:AraC family transcriptional regulator n=1 Tax=Paenibacillus thalictri TaxID=2527873 RepID=A0A4Q9DS20_9BACL|nr:helix-turn-helix domain-containing protein [Paenibacillus thalictri]TBL78544.1 AraC family transcriptional regulator [Paenibacillus thalictri]
MKALKSSYFHKMIIFCFFLITFPVVTVGGFSYIRASHTIQEKVNTGSLQILQQMQTRVEQSLRTADNALTQFIAASSVSKLLANDVRDVQRSSNIQMIEELQEGLRRIQTYDLGMSDVQFIQLRYQWKMTNKGYEPFASDEPDWMRILGSKRGSYWNMGDNSIDLVKTLPLTALDPPAAVILKVPYVEIAKYLSVNEELGKPFIMDGAYRIIAAADSSQIGLSTAAQPYMRQLKEAKEERGIIPIDMNGSRYNLIFSRSVYNGWTYASFVSIEAMTRESESIKWFTLLVCALVLAAGIAVSLFGTRKMYFPILRLYRELFSAAAGQTGPLKGKDELQLIGEKFRAYAHTEKKLSSELQYQRNQLQDFYIMKLFLGEAKQQEMEDKLLAGGETWNSLRVVVVQIDTLEATRYEEKDKELLLFAVNNIVTELVPAADRLLRPIVLDQSQVNVIRSNHLTSEEAAGFIDQITREIQQTVKHYLHIKVSLGISRPFHYVTGAHRAYKEALEALNYRIKLGHEAILYIADVQPHDRSLPEYPEKLKNDLIDAIKLSNKEQAYQLLQQFSHEVFSVQLSHREYQIMMIGLLTDLLRVLQESGGLLQSLYEEEKSLFDRLFELQTSTEIVDWFFHSIIAPSIRLLEEQQSRQYVRISEEMIGMVHSDYDKNLTLEICAYRINYHPDYIRHVFRKEVGIPFGEYLAQYRLQIAKKWLAETDMKISEIAEKLQYNNSQNFIRYFRKMEGMTPGQYRNATDAGAADLH